MKKSFILLVFINLGIWACSNDDDSNTQTPTLNSRLTADVNGERFESIMVGDCVTVSTTLDNEVFTTVSISGTDDAGDRVTVSLSFDELGAYEIGVGMSSGSGRFKDESEDELFAFFTDSPTGSGSVTITSNDGEEIKGTFSFEAFSITNPTESVIVTNGEFTAEYYFPDN